MIRVTRFRIAISHLNVGYVFAAAGAGLVSLTGCAGTPKAREYPSMSAKTQRPLQPVSKANVASDREVIDALASRNLQSLPKVSETEMGSEGTGSRNGFIQQASYNESQGESTLPKPNQIVDPGKPNDSAGANGTGHLRAAGEKLYFDEVINAVLISDPRLMAGFQAVNQSTADALTASLVPNPTILADVLMLPLARPFSPDRTGGPPQQDVMVSYPIDWFVFGKRAAQMASATEQVKVTEAEFANLVRIRVTEGAVAYYDVLEAKALLELAKQNLEVLTKAENVLIKAVNAGGRPKVELNRVRLDILQNRQNLRDAETILVSAKARLRALIGRSDRDPDFDIKGTIDETLSALTPPPTEAFNLAVDNRPDVQAMRGKMLQTEANVIVEDRKKYPELIPMLGWTRQYQVAAMGQPDAGSWNASLTTNLPLFNRNQGNRAKASSLAVQAKIDYEATLVALRAEIETAAQELKAARNNAEAAAEDQLKLANEVLQSITAAYETGGRPLVDMLDAQRNFRETNRSYISTRAAYWRSVYRYYSAIGKQIQQV